MVFGTFEKQAPGPKSYFEIRVSRKVGCDLTSNEFLLFLYFDGVRSTETQIRMVKKEQNPVAKSA